MCRARKGGGRSRTRAAARQVIKTRKATAKWSSSSTSSLVVSKTSSKKQKKEHTHGKKHRADRMDILGDQQGRLPNDLAGEMPKRSKEQRSEVRILYYFALQ